LIGYLHFRARAALRPSRVGVWLPLATVLSLATACGGLWRTWLPKEMLHLSVGGLATALVYGVTFLPGVKRLGPRMHEIRTSRQASVETVPHTIEA